MNKNIDEKKQFRTFGFGLTGFLSIIGGVQIYKGHEDTCVYFFGSSLVALLVSIFIPCALKYIYKVMMFIAQIIGWVNTRILLGILFYFCFAPIGIFLRIIRKDLLDRKFDKSCSTYWKRHEITDQKLSRYEKQF